MRRDIELSKVTHPIPKGSLWTRGVTLAEAEIERGMAPVGRWSRALENRVAAAEARRREAIEEPVLQGMAA